MAYRSHVHCIIYGPPDKMDQLIAKHELLGTNPLHHFKDSIRIGKLRVAIDGSQDSIIELIGEDWKWYESFDDVRLWTHFMHDAADSFDLTYEFLRIGEEQGDIERDCSDTNNDLLYVRREIVSDYDIITNNDLLYVRREIVSDYDIIDDNPQPSE